MSALNVWVRPDRALIGVDTRTLHPGVAHLRASEGSKILPLPHAGIVVAGRGQLLMLTLFSLQLAEQAACFDEARGSGLRHFDRAFGALTKMNRLATAPQDVAAQDLLLVGWSTQRGRMLGVLYRRCTDGIEVQELDDSHFVSTWDDALGELPEPSTPAAMLAIAKAQAVRARTFPDPFPLIGGRLLLAEVTRTSTMIRDMGSIDPVSQPDDLARRGR